MTELEEVITEVQSPDTSSKNDLSIFIKRSKISDLISRHQKISHFVYCGYFIVWLVIVWITYYAGVIDNEQLFIMIFVPKGIALVIYIAFHCYITKLGSDIRHILNE